jgi:hypothetical protein
MSGTTTWGSDKSLGSTFGPQGGFGNANSVGKQWQGDFAPSEPKDFQGKWPKLLHYDGQLWPFNPHNVVRKAPAEIGSFGNYMIEYSYKLDVDGETREVPVKLQLPEMVSSFGLSTVRTKNGGTRASLDLTWYGYERNKDMEDAFHIMLWLDKLDKQALKDNYHEWFGGSQIKEEAVEHLLNERTRRRLCKRTNRTYSPTCNTKVPYRYGQHQLQVYDTEGQPIAAQSLVKKGIKVICLIRMNGLYLGQTISVSQTCEQVVLCSKNPYDGKCVIQMGGKRKREGE